MNRIFVALLLLLLYVSLTATPASMPTVASVEETKVLQASKDNTLIESPKGELSASISPTFFVGRTGQAAGSIRRGLIAFDVAGALPPGARITSVKLTLNMKLSAGGGRPSQVSLHRVAADWGEGKSNAAGGRGAPAAEGDATWIHNFYPKSLWAKPGGDYVAKESAAQAVAGIGAYTWGTTAQMVADVQEWLDSPKKNFGWLLLGDETQGATAKVFQSLQSEDAQARPQLTVTFTPPAGQRRK
ncbi:MAG TPA: DNRLRE domain-containing protein [Pyrinomonadaceae bacterium]